jgi:1,4-dihydroxy-2-naphthoate octaprenyltransferase
MGVLMVTASSYVQVEAWTSRALYASLPVGILVANILHANNLRDIQNDRSRSKVTISTIVDRPMADYILWVLVVASFAVVLVCVALGELSAWSLAVLVALPTAWQTVQVLKETEPVRLNLLVRNSARLHMRVGALLALGLAIAAL